MLSIRLSRTGKIHAPHYRIVVQEKRSKKEGKSIDIIGHYHPAQASKELVIDKEKAEKWLNNGAQPSDTVTNLFVKVGIFDKSRKIYPYIAPKDTTEVTKETSEETIIEEMAAQETKEESEEKTEATETVEAAEDSKTSEESEKAE